uniref:NADH-ubiquinone oxidoreductase chain 6 n=1 Tax=Pelusios castaneus TaxID=367368 RepID=A0A0A6ZDW7_9SAUR|nr:NADH dehydrogenase subunit 6 [Pelusios castaneus]AGL45243.1 NADH dehydrogenase subunit 6 [Pelusios castaneus]
MYVSMLLGVSYVFWLIGVSSNVSVYYGVVSLVCAAATGCGMLAWKGSSFLALMLFLVYLGGMLVIFAYSVTLVMEPFPAVVEDVMGGLWFGGYIVLGVVVTLYSGGWWGEVGDIEALSVARIETLGLSLLYGMGGWVLLVAAFGLFLTFFVVLVLVQGLFRVACRAI